MNKQCWHSQQEKKNASHDNNVEAFMDDYIFYNILAAENYKLRLGES